MPKPKRSPEEALTAIREAGGLIGVNASSKKLGIAPSNFRRYRGELTEVPVDGSASAFFTAEVDQLALRLEERRRGEG